MPHIANDPHNTPPLTDEQLRMAPRDQSRWLSPDLLEAVGPAAVGFHPEARAHFIGHAISSNEFRSLLVMPEDEPAKEIGSGPTPQAALQRAFEGMRSLEEATTPRAEVRIPMTETAHVDLTAVEHYAPRIAPAAEPYEVPHYLQEMVEAAQRTDNPAAATYHETIKQPDWDKKLFSIVDDYVNGSVNGQKAKEALKIDSLTALTPEQAVKLSIGVVHALSKYSFNEEGEADGQQADAMTAMDLLQEGAEHKGDPQWPGNGVCRNVGSNIQAVFEALKRNQGSLSMLHNTYPVFTTGKDGQGYQDRRLDQHDGLHQKNAEDISGHAWNTFVTIDAKGSANITVVDATWVLERDPEAALTHADYTIDRMASTAYKLFEASEQSADAFAGMTQYYQKLTMRPGLTSDRRKELSAFATGEYLRLAQKALKAMPDDEAIVSVPTAIKLAARQLRDRLESSELATLFELNQRQALSDDDMRAIVHQYSALPETVVRPDWQSKQRLLQKDDDLQGMIFEAMGTEKVAGFAEEDGLFRARLREIQPDNLPSFDVSRSADAQELVALAKKQGMSAFSVESVRKTAASRLKRAAGGNAELLDAVLVGRTEYNIVQHLSELEKRLKQIAS